ncbi:DeoR-like transcriptional regulator [Desulfitobacterium dehalogenans ATCC 51507]|uniref:DeoR-like transcriptional regulator n=1 Tax=Desulfitobacterium dehalogenans (strain ATCC 51507 / DSM 9161 / JW/IU-DC1) TaxID=756499 RepID=I4A503_DESDJ|nr:DeoR family transcriptional regulator [Desulfitobacterium dehalogenans]AFL99037.1 DeoR-like transcriptional regulator [Desulfitobacterium dehalogenans ATCC 51507]
MILQNEKHQFSDIELYNKIKRQEKLEFYLTWPVLILTFIFCLPLGIYLIHQRTTVDKEAALKIYKFINVIGWVIVIFLLINMAIDIAMDIELDQFEGGAYGDYIPFLILGVAFIVWARNSKARSIRYKKYLKLVLIERKRKVEDIANTLGISKETVKYDLMKMSAKNYFPGGFFDILAGGMVFPYMDSRKEYTHTKPIVKVEIKVITCKGCGASNSVVEGTIAECEYCGSKLS